MQPAEFVEAPDFPAAFIFRAESVAVGDGNGIL
jgi:hypothetical protein